MSSTIRRFVCGVLLLLVGLAVHASAPLTEAGRTTDGSRPTPQAILATYQSQIQPILVVKCAACHTATPERPLYYSVPVVSLWSQPFIEDHIRRGRVQFDFPRGFPAGRIGAAYEFIARLRNSAQVRDMPPMEYTLVHWSHRLTEAERKTILDWAEAGIAALNTIRNSRDLASADARTSPSRSRRPSWRRAPWPIRRTRGRGMPAPKVGAV